MGRGSSCCNDSEVYEPGAAGAWVPDDVVRLDVTMNQALNVQTINQPAYTGKNLHDALLDQASRESEIQELAKNCYPHVMSHSKEWHMAIS